MTRETAKASSMRPAAPAVVSGSKSGAEYQAHTYPTKIPPATITPFLDAYTEPGDLVLDPFCGSGMTGVAAKMSGRRALLSDLSPGATHVAHNHTHAVQPDLLLSSLNTVLNRLERLARSVYQTDCPTCESPATLRHVIWSDVHRCDGCLGDLVVWELATGRRGAVGSSLTCPSCGASQSRRGVASHHSQPVQKTVDCSSCARLQTGPVSQRDLQVIERTSKRRPTAWVPSVPLDSTREMYRRSALHLRGVENVSDFFAARPKLVLAELYAKILDEPDAELREALRFAFTNTAWHSSRMRRYNEAGGQRPMTGTLYIPQLVAELD